MNAALTISALWIICLLAGSLGLKTLLPKGEINFKQGLFLVLFISSMVRLVPNFILRVGAEYDIDSYRLVAEKVTQGEDVYSSPETKLHHPYLPLQMYWMAVSQNLARFFHLPYVQVVRLAAIAADTAIAGLLYISLFRTNRVRPAVYGGLFYALNPIPVFVSAYHGQFDAIPALCVLLSLWYYQNKPFMAGSWLGLGILSKSWPVLTLPSLLFGVKGWRKRLVFLSMVALILLGGVILYTAIFRANPLEIYRRVTGYNWGVGVWGYTYIFRLFSISRPDFRGVYQYLMGGGKYLTLVALGIIWVIRARKEIPEAGILTILVAFMAVTHAFSIQYLMWVVPFAILNQDFRWLGRYTLAVFPYMYLVYYALIFEVNITKLIPLPQADWYIIIPASIPGWIITIAWFYNRLTKKLTLVPSV